ncbi:hypothetical protein [Estrella lausannensis]|uniref:adenosine deaminase n=1 Tax=Estrella lausannensis TaxID=483423 RepID=A0A0H5DP95_9BACT|nr:hypothetical protein [Estrella lausannensis]CRX38341.1 putative adenosine deaminase [Estrella lausannensis]
MSSPEKTSFLSSEGKSPLHQSLEIRPLPGYNSSGEGTSSSLGTPPISITRTGGVYSQPGNSTHSTSPLSQFTNRIGCYVPRVGDESVSLVGRISAESSDDDAEDPVTICYVISRGGSSGSPKEGMHGKARDDQAIDTRVLSQISHIAQASRELGVGQFLTEIMVDEHYLTQFLSVFPKGGDTHCHLTGSLDANTYLRYAVSLDLVCDPETFIFRKRDKWDASSSGVLTAAEIMSNFSLQTKYYQKATTRGQTVETGLTHHHFFETFPVFESIEKYLKLTQLLAPLLKDAYEQKTFYLETSKGFEFDLDLLKEPPQSQGRWDEDTILGRFELSSPAQTEGLDLLCAQSSEKIPVETLCRKTLYLNSFPTAERFDNKLLPIKDDEQDVELKLILDDKLQILLTYIDIVARQYVLYLDEADAIPRELHKYGFKDSLFSLNNPTVVKLNVDVNRELPLPSFFADLAVAFRLVQIERERPNPRIVGIVISGREHHENALTNRDAQLKMIRYFQHRMPDVRLSLHAGELTEALVPKQAMRGAIRKAIKLGNPSRIGHAVCISQDKNMFELLALLKSKKICVETCFSSNEKTLKVVNGSHPFKKFLNEGIPVTINTDDAGVNGSSLGNEYKIAATRYKLSYDQLKRLARNQIKYSFLPGEEIFDEDYNLKEDFLFLKECQKGTMGCDDIKLSQRVQSILANSPKAAQQYKLELALIRFEEWVMGEMIQNVIRLEEQ